MAVTATGEVDLAYKNQLFMAALIEEDPSVLVEAVERLIEEGLRELSSHDYDPEDIYGIAQIRLGLVGDEVHIIAPNIPPAPSDLYMGMGLETDWTYTGGMEYDLSIDYLDSSYEFPTYKDQHLTRGQLPATSKIVEGILPSLLHDLRVPRG